MLPLDPRTGSVKVVDNETSKIKAGGAFVVKSMVDLSIGQYYDIQIVTPNTTKWGNLIFFLDTESETRWYLYENVAIATPGTAKTAFNRDRNSALTAGVTVKVIVNANESDANADTTVSGGTVLQDGICGAGKDAGYSISCDKIILKQNKAYTIRCVATSAGYVNYGVCWGEHTNQQN